MEKYYKAFDLEDRIMESHPAYLDIQNEERKITIANRLLHRKLRTSPSEYKKYWELRAALLDRVRRVTFGELTADLNGTDPEATAKIVLSKTLLKGKYNGVILKDLLGLISDSFLYVIVNKLANGRPDGKWIAEPHKPMTEIFPDEILQEEVKNIFTYRDMIRIIIDKKDRRKR